ncbi:MAG: hypothetical protein KDE55_05070 [Novosphingobium sp.]|nr:hypothetical protein [Novosphingobium sp.]
MTFQLTAGKASLALFAPLAFAAQAFATEAVPASGEAESDMPTLPPTIDTDGDGTADAWDRNNDGRADAWDTDGDGKPDVFDDDGDGKPD